MKIAVNSKALCCLELIESGEERNAMGKTFSFVVSFRGMKHIKLSSSIAISLRGKKEEEKIFFIP